MSPAPLLFRAGRAVDVASIQVDMIAKDPAVAEMWAKALEATGLTLHRPEEDWSLHANLFRLDEDVDDTQDFVLRVSAHSFREGEGVHVNLRLTRRPSTDPPEQVVRDTEASGGLFRFLENLESEKLARRKATIKCMYLIPTDRWNQAFAGSPVFPPPIHLDPTMGDNITFTSDVIFYEVEGHHMLRRIMLVDDENGSFALSAESELELEFGSRLFHDIDKTTWLAVSPMLSSKGA